MVDRQKIIKALCETPNYTFGSEGVTTLDILKVIDDSRLTPHTPHHTKIQYADGQVWITDECPRCFKNRNIGIWDILIDRYRPYCRRCGQAIDWSEYSGREQIDWEKYMSRKEKWEYDD